MVPAPTDCKTPEGRRFSGSCSLLCPTYALSNYLLIKWSLLAFVCHRRQESKKAKEGVGCRKCSEAAPMLIESFPSPPQPWNLMIRGLYGLLIVYLLDIKSQKWESRGKNSEQQLILFRIKLLVSALRLNS